MAFDLNVMIGGAAGQGIQSLGFILSKLLSRAGAYVFADQDYESRIRGGHSFFRVRARDEEVLAVSSALDMLVALNRETVDIHKRELKDRGIIIYDKEKIGAVGNEKNILDIPLERLAQEKAGNKIMANTVGVGAILGLLGLDPEILATILREHFEEYGQKIVDANITAARAGMEHARESLKGAPDFGVKPVAGSRRMLVDGNQALGMGCLAAGCKFYAGYPMTPSTSLLEFMADKGKPYNVVVVQPEDEIAVINMTIGSAFAGVRAMAGTSGGGFALMVEALSLAGITETPVVIVLGQRPGPAVGLPTRTEQGELMFSLFAGHGEFPRAVLAPATIEECFYIGPRAFNWAEKYQIPVIILTDHHLASSYSTVSKFDLGSVKIDRGQLLSEEEANRLDGHNYKRHQLTDSGISPRALPMIGKAIVVTDSDEHDEEGHLIEDAETRTRMVQKRFRKLDGLRGELAAPLFHQVPRAEITLIGWGSTYGAIREAAAQLQREGAPANILHLNELWPFPAEAVTSALGKTRRHIVVENNATGQLARLIRMETGIKVEQGIHKFDGRPFSPAEILQGLKKEVLL